MKNRNEVYQQLVDRDGPYCSICGKKSENLVLEHILLRSHGGMDNLSNLRLLCQSHNSQLSNRYFNELEFVNYLKELLDKSPQYSQILMEPLLGKKKRMRPDITAHGPNRTTSIIECKASSSFTEHSLAQAIAQINLYREISNFDEYVLAFPGLVSDEQKRLLTKVNITCWDGAFIAAAFANEVTDIPHPRFKNYFQAIRTKSGISVEQNFTRELKSCPPGRSEWSKYQKLIGRIIEHLFTPPLGKPRSESADSFSINRRDWIMANYAEKGFWRYARDQYTAAYIVIDAKNYTNPISKNQVLQISNYLKKRGAGLFAIILTRKGSNRSATLTIRDKWLIEEFRLSI